MTLYLRRCFDQTTQIIADADPDEIGDDGGSDSVGAGMVVPHMAGVCPVPVQKPLMQRLQLLAPQPSLPCFRTADVITEGKGVPRASHVGLRDRR